MTDDSYDNAAIEDLLACATAVAEYTEGDGYAEITEIIALQRADRGELDLALERAETIPDPYLKDRTLGSIALKAIAEKDLQFSLELVDLIEDPMLRETYIEQLAVKTAEEGKFDDARQLADELGDNSPVLGNIALIYAEQDRMAEALDLAQQIETIGVRANTIAQLAEVAAKAGDTGMAADLLSASTTEISDVEFPEDQIHCLVSVAATYGSLGEKGTGFDQLATAYKICRELQGSDPGSILARDEALIEVVGGFARLKFFEKADQIVEEIEGPFQFAHAAIRIAVNYFRDEKDAEAEALLAQAVEICKEEKVYGEQGMRLKNSLYAELAAVYALHNRFDQAIQVARLVEVEADQKPVIETIGTLAARASNHDVVARAAALQNDPTAKAAYWLGVADAFAETSQTDHVDSALSQAQVSAEEVELPYDRVLILGEAAARRHANDQPEKASALFTKALTLVPEIDGHYRKARVLLNLNPKFGRAGRTPNSEEQQALRKIILELEQF